MKKTTQSKILKYGMITSGVITILLAVSDKITECMMWNILKITSNTQHTSSMDIIGEADGPTAIFLGSTVCTPFRYIMIVIFLVSTLVCAMKWKNLRKHS